MPEPAWRLVGEVEPVGRGPFLFRNRPDDPHPRVAVRAGYEGWRLAYEPFTGAPPRMRGHYLGVEEAASWEWAPIPE